MPSRKLISSALTSRWTYAIAILVVAVLTFSVAIAPYVTRRRLIAEIRTSGGAVICDDNEWASLLDEWLPDSVGYQEIFPGPMIVAYLMQLEPDDVLHVVTSERHLDQLTIDRCRIGNESWNSIASLPVLTLLIVTHTEIPVDTLSVPDSLEGLSISSCGLTESALASLDLPDSCEVVNLGGNPISDAAVTAVDWKNVSALMLRHTRVSGQCLYSLDPEKIRLLDLSHTLLANCAADAINRFKNLEALYVRDTSVSGSFVQTALDTIPLRLCDVAYSRVGPDTVRRLLCRESLETIGLPPEN